MSFIYDFVSLYYDLRGQLVVNCQIFMDCHEFCLLMSAFPVHPLWYFSTFVRRKVTRVLNSKLDVTSDVVTLWRLFFFFFLATSQGMVGGGSAEQGSNVIGLATAWLVIVTFLDLCGFSVLCWFLNWTCRSELSLVWDTACEELLVRFNSWLLFSSFLCSCQEFKIQSQTTCSPFTF